MSYFCEPMTDDRLGRGNRTEDLSFAVLKPAWEEYPGEGGNWFADGRGPAAGAQRRWGWPS